jgi:cold shock CspA family protein
MKEKREPRETLGLITRLHAEDGFGWIRGDPPTAGAEGEDYFFHARGVRGGGFDDPERFFEGARVRFIATDSPKGPRAVNVQAIGGSEGPEVDGNRAIPEVVEAPSEEDPL